ncbi:hypothetical protein [Labilibacter marinus]|uniref:hypothetical protein n=1 Tax=Labilibacter marinus TaxID=1477105 RepID=UPI0008347843|nr:NigD-like C-terminal domain-containing protein [Labilibacter marinus]
MKVFKFKQVGVFVLLIATLVGCIKEEEPQPQKYSGWGFVKEISSEYYIYLDNDLMLKVANLDEEGEEKIEVDDRIIIAFTIKNSPQDHPIYNHEIDLESFLVIDYTESIVELNEASRDTIGDGIVQIGEFTHLSGNYLNLDIYYEKEIGQVFSVCYDETIQEDDQPLILELRSYYEEEEDGVLLSNKLQTFNVSNIPGLTEPSEEGYFEFKLRINSGDSQQKEYTFFYTIPQ